MVPATRPSPVFPAGVGWVPCALSLISVSAEGFQASGTAGFSRSVLCDYEAVLRLLCEMLDRFVLRHPSLSEAVVGSQLPSRLCGRCLGLGELERSWLLKKATTQPGPLLY